MELKYKSFQKGLGMAKMSKAEMELALRKVVANTMNLLESLHIVHKDDPIEKILDLKLPIGDDLTLAKLLVNIYKILEPILDIVRKQFPAAFAINDWLTMVVQNLLGIEEENPESNI